VPPSHNLGLPQYSKFALVAVTHCDRRIQDRLDLPNGTIVLPNAAGILDEQWRQWLGELRTNDVEQANLIFLRHVHSAEPNVLDHENERLTQEVSDIFGLLQFTGTPSYMRAMFLTGTVEADRLNIRQIGNVRDFYRPVGVRSTSVTSARLQSAENCARRWWEILASSKFKRFIRGSNILMEALHEYYGQERLHQCVRALEALILPVTGSTRTQFIHRCQTFTRANQKHVEMLGEIFDMRSDVEHVHEWDRSLEHYSVTDRQSIAKHRTRQAQALALTVYSRVLSDSAISQIFESDGSLQSFWALQDHVRKKQWAPQLDLTLIR
jgi:hypothetical protein